MRSAIATFSAALVVAIVGAFPAPLAAQVDLRDLMRALPLPSDAAIEVVNLRGWPDDIKMLSDQMAGLLKARLLQANAPANRDEVERFASEALAPRFLDAQRRMANMIAGEYATKIAPAELRQVAEFLRSPEGRRFWSEYGMRFTRGEFREPGSFMNREAVQFQRMLGEAGFRRFEAFFLSPAGLFLAVDLPKIDSGFWESIGWVLLADHTNILRFNSSQLRRRGLNPMEHFQ